MTSVPSICGGSMSRAMLVQADGKPVKLNPHDCPIQIEETISLTFLGNATNLNSLKLERCTCMTIPLLCLVSLRNQFYLTR